MEKTFENNLTTRQWVLYKTLLDNFPNKLTLEEIHAKMESYYPPITRAKTFTNSQARRILTDDLTALENDDIIQLVIPRIAKQNGGIGIASSYEEAFSYIDNWHKSLKKELKRVSKLKKKLANHNQMRAVFNTEKDHCRAYIEVKK